MGNQRIVCSGLLLCLTACTPFEQPKDDRVFLCRPFSHVWKECAAVPLASALDDKEAKLFSPPIDGKAQVYVVRRYVNEYQKRSKIVLDGRPVAVLGPQTYILLNLDPGQHTFVATTDDRSVLQLTVLPSKTYYIKYSLTQWLGTVSGKLVVTDEEQGQSLVIASKRAIAQPVPQ